MIVVDVLPKASGIIAGVFAPTSAMAPKSLYSSAKSLCTNVTRSAYAADSLMQCLAPRLSRSMATEVPLPNRSIAQPYSSTITTSLDHSSSNGLPPHVPVTIYKFPTMEPLRFHSYPSNHLHLPLRRDILHRAVIYEGDSKRKGLAHTKWRDEVHGSGRKIRPQKGTGMARLGDKKSPVLRGGGVAFGPKPRDFSTELPRKLYDQAWRIALSYRYRKGELLVCENGMDIKLPKTSYVKQIFERNHWGNADGRSLVITTHSRPTNLYTALMGAGEDGRALAVDEVDVKALLELGRIIIEKSALDRLFREHSSDLARNLFAGPTDSPSVDAGL